MPTRMPTGQDYDENDSGSAPSYLNSNIDNERLLINIRDALKQTEIIALAGDTSAGPATTVTGPDAYGAAAAVGTGTHFARNDHDHGLPAAPADLPLAGGTMSGPIAMGTSKITGLGNGSAAQDAAAFGQLPNLALQYNDLLGWTFDGGGAPYVNNTNGAQYVIVNRIPLPAAITVTNVLIDLTVFGVTITHSFLALYNSAGTIIGQTADQSTSWMAGGALGIYTLPLVGGPYLCTPLGANDFLWAAHYHGTQVTAPTFAQSGAPIVIANAGCTTARLRNGYIFQANTATLGNISPAGLTVFGAPYWMAIS